MATGPATADGRRSLLLAAKLGALVRDHWGAGDRSPAAFHGGAALRSGRTAWVLVDDDPARSLGKVLLWTSRAGATEVHILAEDAEDLLARRAAAFGPPPTVWRVAGRDLSMVTAGPAPPEPPLDRRAGALADVIRAAGAEPMVEHGVLTGEVLGLEVARVVVDDDGARLEIGVGKHDREGHLMLGHGISGSASSGSGMPGHATTADAGGGHGMPGDAGVEALAAVVTTVRRLRRAGATAHPYRLLAAERWLRCRLLDEPGLVGAAHLVPVPAPSRRRDLRQAAAAPAAGVDAAGRPLLVVCSTGIDLDLVPAAADARVADGREPRVLLVVPERDDHPATRTLAGALAEPAEVVTVPDDWRRP